MDNSVRGVKQRTENMRKETCDCTANVKTRLIGQ